MGVEEVRGRCPWGRCCVPINRDDLFCEARRPAYDALAAKEDWEYAGKVLDTWVAFAREFGGSEALIEAAEDARDRAAMEVAFYAAELESHGGFPPTK